MPLNLKTVRMLAGLLIWSLFTGCQSEQAAPEAMESVPVPDTYADVELSFEDDSIQTWSRIFSSAEIQNLLHRLHKKNFSFQSAVARIREAQALTEQAEAAQWPHLRLEGSAARSKREFLIPGNRTVFRQDQIELGLAASYEIDLWGKLAERETAARLEVEARQADLAAMKVSLNATVVENYLRYLASLETVAVIDAQRERAIDQNRLLDERFLKGQGTALDLARQKQLIEGYEIALIETRRSADLILQALANLLSENPQTFDIDKAALPDPPPVPDPGVPADLLLQRPDLKAAFLRLRAQDARAAAAAAEKLPQMTLSARGFTAARAVENLFETFLWSIAGDLAQNLFDAGATEARLTAAEQRAQAALAEFGQAWMAALEDMSNAFTSITSSDNLFQATTVQLETARDNLDLSRNRYLKGMADYLRVLDAAQSVDEIERQIIQIRLEQLLARVKLIRALGGSWQASEAYYYSTIDEDQ